MSVKNYVSQIQTGFGKEYEENMGDPRQQQSLNIQFIDTIPLRSSTEAIWSSILVTSVEKRGTNTCLWQGYTP